MAEQKACSEEVQLQEIRNGEKDKDSEDEKDVSAPNRGLGHFLMKGASSIADVWSTLGGYREAEEGKARTQPLEEV